MVKKYCEANPELEMQVKLIMVYMLSLHNTVYIDRITWVDWAWLHNRIQGQSLLIKTFVVSYKL